MDRLAEAHNLPTIENAFYDSAIEGYVPLQHGAVCGIIFLSFTPLSFFI